MLPRETWPCQSTHSTRRFCSPSKLFCVYSVSVRTHDSSQEREDRKEQVYFLVKLIPKELKLRHTVKFTQIWHLISIQLYYMHTVHVHAFVGFSEQSCTEYRDPNESDNLQDARRDRSAHRRNFSSTLTIWADRLCESFGAHVQQRGSWRPLACTITGTVNGHECDMTHSLNTCYCSYTVSVNDSIKY